MPWIIEDEETAILVARDRGINAYAVPSYGDDFEYFTIGTDDSLGECVYASKES